MAVTLNGFNIGTDASVAFTDNYGDSFTADQLGYMMDFNSRSEDTEVKIVPITGGGVPVYQTIWSGINGSIMFTRANGNLAQMFVDLMEAYYTNGVIPQFTMSLNVRNRDTSAIDEYIFHGVQFVKPDFGNYRATKEVDQRLDFKAATMQTTGGATPFLSSVASATA